MTGQTARELLMNYLYDEISAAEKKKLEAYLADHPGLQQELDELQKTRSLLQQAPEVEPAKKLQMVDAEKDSFSNWWQNTKTVLPQSGWGKTALAAAACLILLLVAGSLANLTIHSTQSGFSVQLGYVDQPQPALMTESQMEEILLQIRQENTGILTEYADMLNQHNSQQLQQVVDYFEQQRVNDLQLVEQALNEYQIQTETQITQTQQVLGEVIQTVAANDQQ